MSEAREARAGADHARAQAVLLRESWNRVLAKGQADIDAIEAKQDEALRIAEAAEAEADQLEQLAADAEQDEQPDPVPAAGGAGPAGAGQAFDATVRTVQ